MILNDLNTFAMTFYLNPPTGSISYQKMELYALNRLKFLIRLQVCKDVSEQMEVVQDAQAVLLSDCLIEGTVKDNISHYLLRLVLGCSRETSELFLEAETALFSLRLRSFNEDEWREFFMSLDRFLLFQDFDHDVLRDLKRLHGIIKQHFCSVSELVKEVASHETSTSAINIPFQLLYNLVATRSVHLSKGMALLPMSKFVDVFAEQFCKILLRVMRQSQATMKILLSDKRILRLERVIKHAYMQEVHPIHRLASKGKAIRLASLQDEMQSFPPCMFRLMRNLIQHHRLQHHHRIQLTLYLKELGLPLHEALLLWKREYSQKSALSSSNSCTHPWQGNERRYTYSIRHLYGLEGSRTQYKAHCCRSIQGRHSSTSVSDGCAFLSPDIESLSEMFALHDLHQSASCVNHLSRLSKAKQHGRACNYFMYYKANILKDQKDAIDKEPVETLSPIRPNNFMFDSFKCIQHRDHFGSKIIEPPRVELEGKSARHLFVSAPGLSASKRRCLKLQYKDESFSQLNPVGTKGRCCFSSSSELNPEKKMHVKMLTSHCREFNLGRYQNDMMDLEKKQCRHWCNNLNNLIPCSEVIQEPTNIISTDTDIYQMSSDVNEMFDSVNVDSILKKNYNPWDSNCDIDNHSSISNNVLGKRKRIEISDQPESAVCHDLGCINQPSQFYWTYRSLVEGFKQCDPPG